MPDRATSPGQSEISDCPFFLSPRQRQVLTCAAQGYTDMATARQLGIAPRTVVAHLQRTRQVLGAQNTTHAVAIAVAWRLIKQDIFIRGIKETRNHEAGFACTR